MDSERTKQYLNQINRLELQIKNKLEEIHRLRLMSDGVGGISDGEKVQTSGNKDKMSVIVSKIVDMEREVDSMIDKRCLIIEQIEKIENSTYYDILTQIYVLQKDLKVIAYEKKRSYRQIQRLKGNAIEEFERLYSKFIDEMS